MSKSESVSKLTRRGVTWTLLGAVVSNALRIVVIAILGRVLMPSDFGVVAAAMTVIFFGNTLKDMGVGAALVQRKDLTQEHIEAAFTFSLLLGVGLGAITFFAAPFIGAALGIEASIPLVRVLSLLFVFRGATVVPLFLCRRHMNFRAITVADTSGYVAGSLLSIALALADFGAWSLVWGYLLEVTVELGLLFYLEPPPRIRLHRPQLRELLGFGMGQTFASLANYLANQGDYMVVGHALGPTQLGLYQRAYELIRFPANLFTNIAGSVLFSAFAKVQDDRPRLARALRRTMFASALVLLPASLGLIVLAPEVIALLLGPNWDEVVLPFRVMATAMLFRTTYKLGGLVARSSGQVFVLAGLQVVYAALVIVGALISVRYGIIGVACTTTIAVVIHFINLTTLGARVTGATARDLIAVQLVALAIAIVIGALSWGVALAAREQFSSNAVVAILTSVVGGVAFLAIVIPLSKRQSGDWPWLRDLVVSSVRRKRRQK